MKTNTGTNFYLTLTNRDFKILMTTNFQFPLGLSNKKRKIGDIRSAESVKLDGAFSSQ